MQTKTEDGITYEVPDKADEQRVLANAIEDLASRLSGAESIKDSCPVLSELFHEARTTKRSSRDGRFVALLDYDGEWTCRRVTFVQQGTHLRNHGADLVVTQSPYPFMGVAEFAQSKRNAIKEKAQVTRQKAHRIEQKAKEEAYREENWTEEDYR